VCPELFAYCEDMGSLPFVACQHSCAVVRREEEFQMARHVDTTSKTLIQNPYSRSAHTRQTDPRERCNVAWRPTAIKILP
jgi:hypothetical protein